MEPATGIRNFLEYFLHTLVRQPEAVVIEQSPIEGGVHFEIKVAGPDVPRVAGRSYRTVHALRNLASASAALHQMKVTIHLDDPNPRPAGDFGGERRFGGGNRGGGRDRRGGGGRGGRGSPRRGGPRR